MLLIIASSACRASIRKAGRKVVWSCSGRGILGCGLDDTKHAQLETAFKELDGKMTGEFTSIGEKISELEKRKSSSERFKSLKAFLRYH